MAEVAFSTAYRREIDSLVRVVREQAGTLATTDDIWQLHDFLSARRHELDGKYDSRESALIFVFSSLVKDGWLSLEELTGLAPEKVSKISALTRIL